MIRIEIGKWSIRQSLGVRENNRYVGSKRKKISVERHWSNLQAIDLVGQYKKVTNF